MKKYFTLLSFIWMTSFSHAESNQNFSYCNGLLVFSLPAGLDRSLINEMSKRASCKNSLVIRNKIDGKKVTVDVKQGGQYEKPSNFNDEFLAHFKNQNLKKISFSNEFKYADGGLTILNIYWTAENGEIKEIERNFYFGKVDSISAFASIKVKASDGQGLVFLEKIQEIFFTARSQW